METPKPRHRVLRRFVAPPVETPFAGEQSYVANEKLTPTCLLAAALERKARLASKSGDPRSDPPFSVRGGPRYAVLRVAHLPGQIDGIGRCCAARVEVCEQ